LPASHELTTLEQKTVPMIPLRGLVIFPGTSMSFDVARPKSRAAVKAAIDSDQMVFVTAQIPYGGRLATTGRNLSDGMPGTC